MLKKENKLLLKSANLRPIKYRGQNFLISKTILKKVIASADIKSGETILEIGPGTGNLTQVLLETGASVVAVEKDQNLVEILKSKVKSQKLKVVEEDILKFEEIKINRPYKIVANIPYYLTGQLIQKFLLSQNPPQFMILMVQKEVGERIAGQPPRANYFSSLVQFLAEPKILFKVKKENFWPQPKIDSVVIKLTPHHLNKVRRSFDIVEMKNFIDFLRLAFKQPRQTLFNNLKKSKALDGTRLKNIFEKLKLATNIRPQNLNPEQLLEILKEIT